MPEKKTGTSVNNSACNWIVAVKMSAPVPSDHHKKPVQGTEDKGFKCLNNRKKSEKYIQQNRSERMRRRRDDGEGRGLVTFTSDKRRRTNQSS